MATEAWDTGMSDLSSLKIPTLADVEAARKGKPILKGPSRLQQTEHARPLTVVTDAAFKRTVRARDKMRCRKCSRKVEVVVARTAKRAEVHHVYGRRGALRHDDRFALLLCLACHEQVTGRVNERWRIVSVPTSTCLIVDGRELIDCRGALAFERIT